MKMSNFWKLILLSDSNFDIIVCDSKDTLFHVDINPAKKIYYLPQEFKEMDVECFSIKGNEMHVWVK